MAYTIRRFDTLPRAERDQLLDCYLGWEVTGKPQWFIADEADEPVDWPLLNTHAEAVADVREFNNEADADDEEDRSEARNLARMSGDLSA